MATQREDPAESSIAELFHQLVDDGRHLVRAELNLYREIARYRTRKASVGLVAIAGAGALFLAALIVLLLMLAIWLSVFVGPVGAGAIVAAFAAAIGYGLLRYGLAKAQALAGDDEERKALRDAESKA